MSARPGSSLRRPQEVLAELRDALRSRRAPLARRSRDSDRSSGRTCGSISIICERDVMAAIVRRPCGRRCGGTGRGIKYLGPETPTKAMPIRENSQLFKKILGAAAKMSSEMRYASLKAGTVKSPRKQPHSDEVRIRAHGGLVADRPPETVSKERPQVEQVRRRKGGGVDKILWLGATDRLRSRGRDRDWAPAPGSGSFPGADRGPGARGSRTSRPRRSKHCASPTTGPTRKQTGSKSC